MTAILLGGCGHQLKGLKVAADEVAFSSAGLCRSLTGKSEADCTGPANPIPADNATDTDQTKAFLGYVLMDSERKCNAFLTTLVLNATGTNTSLDMATTLFSALGTAFTPLSTVHALTAAAAVSSGWKTAIDSNVYARATIANYAQAIQGTYYRALKDYTDKLPTAPVANKPLEISKIQSMHRQCSLAAAQATIASTLRPGSPEEALPKTAVYTITKDALAQKNDFTATVEGKVVAKVSYQNGKSVKKYAEGLKDAINASEEFKKAQISANNAADQVILTYPYGVDIAFDLKPSEPKDAGLKSFLKLDLTSAPLEGKPARGGPTSAQVPGAPIR